MNSLANSIKRNFRHAEGNNEPISFTRTNDLAPCRLVLVINRWKKAERPARIGECRVPLWMFVRSKASHGKQFLSSSQPPWLASFVPIFNLSLLVARRPRVTRCPLCVLVVTGTIYRTPCTSIVTKRLLVSPRDSVLTRMRVFWRIA